MLHCLRPRVPWMIGRVGCKATLHVHWRRRMVPLRGAHGRLQLRAGIGQGVHCSCMVGCWWRGVVIPWVRYIGMRLHVRLLLRMLLLVWRGRVGVAERLPLLLLPGLPGGPRWCLRSCLLLCLLLTFWLCGLLLRVMLPNPWPFRMLWRLGQPKARHVAGGRRDDSLRGREGYCSIGNTTYLGGVSNTTASGKGLTHSAAACRDAKTPWFRAPQ